MANLGAVYNRADMPEDEFSPIPAGDYVAAIVSSDRVESKGRPGNYYVKLQVEILEGKYKGRKLFENLNLWNSNETAVKIAKTTLGQIMDATGKTAAADTAEFHGIPVTVTVSIKPGENGYNDSNNIKKWARAAAQKAAAPSAPVSKPWESATDEWK